MDLCTQELDIAVMIDHNIYLKQTYIKVENHQLSSE